MPIEFLQKLFVQWLNYALADAGWRAFIRERLARNQSQLTEIQF